MKKNPDSTRDDISKQDSSFTSSQAEERKFIVEDDDRRTALDSLRICLFCDHASDGVKMNLDHMRKKHSFFVMDIDCLISLKSLMYYLAEKI